MEKIPAWNLTKGRSKSEVIDEVRTKGAKVHFASLMDICHLKSAELESKHQSNKGRVVLRGDIVKDDSGSHAVFTEQGSSASQMTAAKVMDIISRLSGCAGQAADAVSAYTQVKMEDAPKLLKFPNRNVQTFGFVLPGLFLGCALYAVRNWKGDIMVADIEELETMDASEISSKRLNAKEVTFPRENGKFIFPVADGRIKFAGGDQELRTSTLIRDHPIQGESHIDFLGESEGSLPPPHDSFPDAGEAINVFGPFQETSFSVITLNPESNCTCRKKNHSPFH